MAFTGKLGTDAAQPGSFQLGSEGVVSVDVTATLTGAATFDAPQLTNEISAVLGGSADLIAPILYDQFNLDPLPLQGSATVTADAVVFYGASASLAGVADITADTVYLLMVTALLTGGSTLTSEATGTFAVDATLAGGSTLTGALVDNLSATLMGNSDLIVPEFTRIRYLDASLSSLADVLANILWVPHPGPLPPQPSVNAAATLKQFIDALGLEKAATKTPPANNTVIVVNPPRRRRTEGER